jgi:predicted nucleotidyltransferase
MNVVGEDTNHVQKMNLIQQHINSINDLCKKHKVKELYAFGSVLDENRFNDESDVDLIVKFNDGVLVEDYADLFFDLADGLELIFTRRVDLMINKHIPNKYLRENIEETKKIIYEA